MSLSMSTGSRPAPPVLRQEPDQVRQLRLADLQTDHFEIYYYPEIEQHLERHRRATPRAPTSSISSELKHDLAFKVPLILFKTQQRVPAAERHPGALQEGVGAFAEP
jgi:hypothetical protein